MVMCKGRHVTLVSHSFLIAHRYYPGTARTLTQPPTKLKSCVKALTTNIICHFVPSNYRSGSKLQNDVSE